MCRNSNIGIMYVRPLCFRRARIIIVPAAFRDAMALPAISRRENKRQPDYECYEIKGITVNCSFRCHEDRHVPQWVYETRLF